MTKRYLVGRVTVKEITEKHVVLDVENTVSAEQDSMLEILAYDDSLEIYFMPSNWRDKLKKLKEKATKRH